MDNRIKRIAVPVSIWEAGFKTGSPQPTMLSLIKRQIPVAVISSQLQQVF